VVATFPVHAAEDVNARSSGPRGRAVVRELGYDGRRKRLRAWRTLLVQRSDELAELMHRENGKPVEDALGEVVLAVEHLSWAAANAEKVLGRRRVAPGMLAMNHSASTTYVPYGSSGHRPVELPGAHAARLDHLRARRR